MSELRTLLEATPLGLLDDDEAARLAAWRRAEARRWQHHDDVAGIGGGIDRRATLALYRSRRVGGLLRGYLRVILCGGVYTQSRLHQMGKAPSLRIPQAVDVKGCRRKKHPPCCVERGRATNSYCCVPHRI